MEERKHNIKKAEQNMEGMETYRGERTTKHGEKET